MSTHTHSLRTHARALILILMHEPAYASPGAAVGRDIEQKGAVALPVLVFLLSISLCAFMVVLLCHTTTCGVSTMHSLAANCNLAVFSRRDSTYGKVSRLDSGEAYEEVVEEEGEVEGDR